MVRRGATIWFTGLPGAGKTTLAGAVECSLAEMGRHAHRLDGDELRRHLSSDLGFDRASRAEHARRAANVARVLADAGVIALVALVSPYASDRRLARDLHDEAGLPFLEVYVDTPIAECERRDPNGLYRRARSGEIARLTGVDDPYEPPQQPELRLIPGAVEDGVQAVIELLMQAGVVERRAGRGREPTRAAAARR